MSAVSETWLQATLWGTPSVISSQASESGATPSAAQDGQTTSPHGQGVVPVSPSAAQASEGAQQTTGTFGRSSSASLRSAALQSSLVSRYRARTDSLGSTLYTTTWKVRTTPSGRSISAQRASGRRTSGSACTGWPTPDASVAQDGEAFETWEKRRLETKARVGNGNGFGTPLTIAAQMAGWPTPRVSDTNGAGAHGDGGADLRTTATLAGWPTPQSFDASNDGQGRALRYKGDAPSEAGNTRNPEMMGSYRGDLKDYALLAGGATPTTRDWEDGHYQPNVPENSLLGRQVWQVSGEMLSGSTARTASTGQLNPELPRWLQGLPPEWGSFAPTAMPSARRSQKPS